MEPASLSSEAKPAILSSFPGIESPVAPHRPANLTRSAFHAGCGSVALVLIHALPSRGWLIGVAGAFALAAWSMETARRLSPRINDALMRLFGPVAHPHERYRVNSSTWYVTALLILAVFAGTLASTVGVAVLAVADPAAGIIGRRFGKTKLRASRSLEGSAAFFAVALGASLLALACLAPMTSTSARSQLGVALAAAIAGTLTELFSFWADDNLTIPLVVAAAVSIAASLLGS